MFTETQMCHMFFLVRHVFLRSAAKVGHLNAICYAHMSTHMNIEIYYMILICKYTYLPLKKSIFAELWEIPGWRMIANPPILINSPFKPFAKIYRLVRANTCQYLPKEWVPGPYIATLNYPIQYRSKLSSPQNPQMGGFFHQTWRLFWIHDPCTAFLHIQEGFQING